MPYVITIIQVTNAVRIELEEYGTLRVKLLILSRQCIIFTNLCNPTYIVIYMVIFVKISQMFVLLPPLPTGEVG